MSKKIYEKDYNIEENLYHIEEEKKPQMLFNNLIWLTTKEAAAYLRKSVNAIHTLVSRKRIRARKFTNRLYFKKDELDFLIETSQFKGG